MSLTGPAPSVYQTDGKPLSPEALYRAKLKYGIYNNPSTASIGVKNSSTADGKGIAASDTAALLATSSDLSIKPYQRTISTDAQTAALFARKDTAPSRWSKDYIDVDAANAALNAKSIGKHINPKKIDNSTSNAAAISVLNSQNDSKKSITSTNSIGSNNTLNIENLTKVSEKKAKDLINSRINSNWNQSRSGIQSKLFEENSSTNFATVGALASQKSNSKINEQQDDILNAKKIYKNSLIDPKVLTMARLNADFTLQNINKKLGEQDLFLNPDFNKIAMEIAQNQSKLRLSKNDKINLGGGLFMNQDEINLIASQIVNPVLDDISIMAKNQREKDEIINKSKQDQINLQRKLKMEKQSKILEEKRIQNLAKIERRNELKNLKNEQNQLKLNLKSQKNLELKKHQEILQSKKKEEEFKKLKLENEKKSQDEFIQNEILQNEKIRNLELKKIENQRDAKLSPILSNLKIEVDKLNVLKQEKQAIEEITNSQIKNTEIAKSLLESSQNELINSESQLFELQKIIENSQNESEKLLKESEILKKKSEISIKKSENYQAKLFFEKNKIDEEKILYENEKLNLQLELENIKIEILEQERKFLEVGIVKNDEVSKNEGNESLENEGNEALKNQGNGVSDTSKSIENNESLPKTIITATGPIDISSKFKNQGEGDQGDEGEDYDNLVSNNQSRKTINDESGVITPSNDSGDATGDGGDGGELKQTFTGFSQGSNHEHEEHEHQGEGVDDKHKSFFKEEF